MNVEAAARVLLKKSRDKFMKVPDVLVYGKDGAEIAALKRCEQLIAEGRTVYNFVGGSRDTAEKYAKDHGISKIEIIDSNNMGV